MKVNHGKVNIELEDDERLMLKRVLCIAEEICNDSVRKEQLSGILVRAGLDVPRDAGQMRQFVSDMDSQL